MSDGPAQTKTSAKHVAAVLGAAALAAPLMMASEGLVTRTSPDPVGIPTACWGHANAEAGKTYTLGGCEQTAILDLAKAGAGIAPCIRVQIPDETRAALTDFAFNAGAGAYCGSTLAKRINAGEGAAACAELSKWVYAAGKPLPGLVKRREAERALCEQGFADADAAPPAVPDRPPTPAPPAKVAPPPAHSPPAKPSIWARLKEWLS